MRTYKVYTRATHFYAATGVPCTRRTRRQSKDICLLFLRVAACAGELRTIVFGIDASETREEALMGDA